MAISWNPRLDCARPNPRNVRRQCLPIHGIVYYQWRVLIQGNEALGRVSLAGAEGIQAVKCLVNVAHRRPPTFQNNLRVQRSYVTCANIFCRPFLPTTMAALVLPPHRAHLGAGQSLISRT
ncbi:hypothetical protein PAXRUDRAFT_608906 [Paxillus rubicundulus Ve08.2h10]|uniref:Uncharacterized protein n=1 Tax=Paxillus rubicundulus Ve08.2h10 TaxID=930991 RepID=A0A0D0DKV3_9AGAM|nr:hypothetical protein PAXRUDRAFT_608906 [Paxillus rubicundulus Ve08.2h10]